MKGCLKYSPTPSPGLPEHPPSESRCNHRKCVAFGAEGSEEVYTADEWDRTPTEPARKLTYQDLLELKEIQRSLPRANQPCDTLSGRPSRHYLSAVPIGLLPLLPDGETTDTDSADGEGSSLAGSPMEGSRTGSPVPGHAPAHGYTQHHQGHGFGFGYHPPPPERAPVSPWSMNFHRASPPVSAQGNSSYFPAVPSPPPSSPALGGTNTRPAYCYAATTSSSFYMTATPASTSPSVPSSPVSGSPTIHAPTALAYSISSSSTSSMSSTSSAGRMPSGLAHLTHLLPARPKPQRVRPRFDFLPLLETPPSSVPSSALSSVAPSRAESPVPTPTTDADADEGSSPCGETTPTDPDAEHEFPRALHDDFSMSSSSEADTDGDGDGAPPTPALTNASLDSSPRSRASSLEPREGDFAHLARVQAQLGAHGQEKEQARARSVERFARVPNGESVERRRPASVSRERGADSRRCDAVPARGCTSAGGSRQVSRERTQVSAATMFSGAYAPFRAPPPPPPSPPVEAKPRAKKRNFIVVNDMEIELDDDDDDEEEEKVADAAQEKGAQPPADTALSETHIPRFLPENAHDAAATPHASPVRA